ncbi:DUF4351 domain-containing protein [Orrella sp. JC864]|uniref:DUF4351 domain-containing protein n=1 Tax=Orrella sp. JC864 TaxID=3120298 RepID=UPI0012BD079C
MSAFADHDSPWKEAIERYFRPFTALLWPALHQWIDWRQPVGFLDKELQKVVRDADSGRRYADKLVQVCSHRHGQRLVLIHVEIQDCADRDFLRRMHRYYYRVRDAYQDALVESMAVLTRRDARADRLVYREAALSCSLEFRFPVVNLVHWLGRWQELEAATASNPFAVVVMAQLLAGRQDRLAGKIGLTRLLLQRGYGRQDVLELYRLIDWMIALPPDQEVAFIQASAALEKEHDMPFVLTAERVGERRGLERGLEQGRQQGQAELLRTQLSRRFGPLPQWAEQRLAQGPASQLTVWGQRLLDASSLDEVFAD